jgi:purine nucleosidase
MKELSRRLFIKKAVGTSLVVPVTGSIIANELLLNEDHTSTHSKRKKVIFDTDIGNDADDAVCLAYLLLQPACDLLGVTTVGMDSGTRAKVTEVLARNMGRNNLRIAAGCDKPFVSNLWWGHHKIFASPILKEHPAEKTYIPNNSVELMQEIVRENPGEVTLLAVGPLSNVAAFLRADPHTFGKLKEVVIMGGRFGKEPRRSTNFMLDPASAASVHQHVNVPTRIAGGETTGPLHVSRETMEDWFGSPPYKLLYEICKAWVDRPERKGNHLSLHDPFAASLIFEPDLCEYQRVDIGVQFMQRDIVRDIAIEGDELTGYTTFTPNKEGKHRIVRNVKKQQFHNHLEQIWKFL